jgi:hypothetical protein
MKVGLTYEKMGVTNPQWSQSDPDSRLAENPNIVIKMYSFPFGNSFCVQIR